MRKTLLIVGAIVVVVAIGALVVLSGDSSKSNAFSSAVGESQPAAVDVPVTELAQGTRSVVTTRTNYLITSASELAKLWELIDVEGEPPAVDFTKNVVAAVFAGEKSTTGYTISVSKVADGESRLVSVTLASPGTTCILAQSTTAPYQVVELPTTSLSFTHQDESITTECGR